jgi:hypothetical protein
LLVDRSDGSGKQETTAGEGTTLPTAKRVAGDGDEINLAPTDAALGQTLMDCCLGNAT